MHAAARAGLHVGEIPGVVEFWKETRGDPRVIIGVIDGPFDAGHPALAGAHIEVLPGCEALCRLGSACAHGTAIASLLFGQPGSIAEGIAPGCRSLWLPLLRDSGGDGEPAACSQLDLARGIELALEWGVTILNISAGERCESGEAHPLLTRALNRAAREGVAVVAAAGNETGSSLPIPASHPDVLVVARIGQHSSSDFVNRLSQSDRGRGLLTVGDDLVSASPGGGVRVISGTSPAAAVTSGLGALALSYARMHALTTSRHFFLSYLLDSDLASIDDRLGDWRRLRNLRKQLPLIPLCHVVIPKRGESMATIDEQAELSHPDSTSLGSDPGRGYRDFAGGLGTSVTTASAPGTAVGCGCAACRGGSKAHTTSGFVYGLGQLDYDLVSEARRDSLQTEMDPAGLTRDPSNAKELLAHLKTNEWATASVIWTLCLDDTPIYALTPEGPYAGKLFQWFREALEGITQEKVDRVSVAGRLAGHSRLLTGQVVPNLVPDPRGFFAWKTDDLIEQAIGKKGKPGAKGAKEDPDDWKRAGIRNLIHRVYYELRNLGLTSQDRAINFAATQAFKEFEQVFEEKHKEEIELDSIQVERSPVCRPESDCWDVVLAFFFPGRPQPAVRKMFRFTIDVSDVIPVRIGLPRTWHAR